MTAATVPRLGTYFLLLAALAVVVVVAWLTLRDSIPVWASEVSRLLGERSARLALAALVGGALVVAGVGLVYPETGLSVVLGAFTSFVGAVVGGAASYSLLHHHLLSDERTRIRPPADVVEFYADDLELPNPAVLPGWENVAEGSDPWQSPSSVLPGRTRTFEQGDLRRLPSSVFHEPDGLPPAASVPITVSAESYTIPDRIDDYYEPFYEALRASFVDGGYFNSLLARLDTVDGGEFRFSRTTYYRSYLTNMNPDRRFSGHPDEKPARTLFERDVVSNGDAVPLRESPFSNDLGGGGLIVTKAGRVLLGVRSNNTLVANHEVCIPFSGTFEYGRLRGGNETQGLLRGFTAELEEEQQGDCDVIDRLEEMYYLGGVRRLEWVGKPDVFSIALIDGPIEDLTSNYEFADTLIVDPGVDADRVTGRTLRDPEFAEALIESVLQRVGDHKYPPSTGLLNTLYLYWRRIDRA